MEAFLISYGYLSLFLLSFFASSIIPLGSEWLLILMVAKGSDPAAAVTIATVGNTLGACTTWYVGKLGSGFLTKKVLRMKDDAIAKAEERFTKYGSWALLFTWVPVVGDGLCVVAGTMEVPLLRFIPLVAIGKLARYAVMAGIVTKLV